MTKLWVVRRMQYSKRNFWRRRRCSWFLDGWWWRDFCCLWLALISDGGRCCGLKCQFSWWWRLLLRCRLSASRRRSSRRSCSWRGLARRLASRGSRLPPAYAPLLVDSRCWLILMELSPFRRTFSRVESRQSYTLVEHGEVQQILQTWLFVN